MAGLDAMSYTDLCQSIEKGAEVKERAAKNRVKEWQEMGIITKLASGLYTLKN